MIVAIWAFLIAVVAAATAGGIQHSQKVSADTAQLLTGYADVALYQGEQAVMTDLATQVQQVGPEGPFQNPAPSALAPACPSSSTTCPYQVQVSVSYTGALDAGGVANTVAQNANRATLVRESPVYALITATVFDAHGIPLAHDSETETYRTQLKSPYVLPFALNAPGSKADLAAEGDRGGCDPGNPTSCGATWNGAAAQTKLLNFDQCADDGNPDDGLCGPATPRPDDNWQTLSVHSGNVDAFGGQ